MPAYTRRSVVYDRRSAGALRRRGAILTENEYRIREFAPVTLETGTQPVQFEKEIVGIDGKRYFFFFGVVIGASGGNVFCPKSETTYHFQAGSSAIQEIGVYVLKGDGGGAGELNEIWVDAFDVDRGNFSDSPTIVRVSTPQAPDQVDAQATQLANQEGVVITTQPWLMRALPSVSGTNKFTLWRRSILVPALMQEATLPDTQTPQVTVETGTNNQLWLAVYQTPQADPEAEPPEGLSVRDPIWFFITIGGLFLLFPGRPLIPIISENFVLGTIQALFGVTSIAIGASGLIRARTASRTRD